MPELEAGIEEIRSSPKQEGRLEWIVRRPAKNKREVLEEGELTIDGGLSGDCWSRVDRNLDYQITLMNSRTVALVAGELERWALAGDQLYVDMDLSAANLPAGTRLEIGSAEIEITSEPHTGCGKFAARFGVDAVKFVNSPLGRQLNLRGVNARVVKAGRISKGDAVRKK